MTSFNNDFRYDLEFGQIRERRVRHIIEDSKMEVKTDLQWWKWGTLAVEFECRGKPSGLATTQAKNWWVMLEKDGRHVCSLVFPVDELRGIIKALDEQEKIRWTMGGDDNMSRLALVPLSLLFDGNLTYDHQPVMSL